MSDIASSVLTGADRQTLQVAAHGVVALMAASDPGPISSTRAGMAGGNALASATGLVGHVLAEKPEGIKAAFNGKSVADLADTVFPALASSVRVLREKAPAEAKNFKSTIGVIASSAAGKNPSPAQTAMIEKITAALNA